MARIILVKALRPTAWAAIGAAPPTEQTIILLVLLHCFQHNSSKSMRRAQQAGGVNALGHMTTMKLSDFIRANIEPILEGWEQFAKNIVPAVHMDKAALRDHASGILRAIAADLDHAQTDQEQAEKGKGRGSRSANESEAELHGTARVSAGFSVNDEFAEFRALRASILKLWADSSPGGLTSPSHEIVRFNEAIDQALSESIARYSSVRDQTHLLLDTILSTSPDLHYIFDLEGRFIYSNDSLAKLIGSPSSEFLGKSFQELGVPAAGELERQVRDVIDTKSTHRGEMPCTLPSGEARTYEYLFVPVVDREGNVVAIAGTGRDVTERKASEQKVWRSANYDALTALPNRSLFWDRLEREVKRAERTGSQLALLYIDLDGFKSINDRFGHDAGDRLLPQAAKRIASCVRGTDTVARLGGDEFTVILTDVSKNTHIEILAGEILNELAKPFSILENAVQISGSIGITLFPQDAATSEGLLKNADQAMYVAKNAGRNRAGYFTPAMRDSAWARLKVIDELRCALLQRQFSVYYQPIIDLSVDRIVKAEALLRWNHPQSGLMLPGKFVGLAEEIGLIGEIDSWVMSEAIKWAQEWSRVLGTPFQISVNKSPAELMSKEPIANWDAHLAALGLIRNNISVEITEGVLLIDSPRVRERLDNLQKAGVQLAVDDFGTGHSSMAYLKKFEVNYLKIDQTFVRDMATSRDSRIIAEAIIVMAHKLGLKVIAEGVETAEQRDWLKAAECDYAQGYFFSEPIPCREFGKLLGTVKAQ